MWRLLGERDTRLFMLAASTSSIGDSALWLTLSIWVKVLTGSTSAAGLSIFMLTLGTLTGPLTGLVVDRVRRRPLLILTNLITCLLVSSLLLVHRAADVWLIDVVMFGYGVSVGVVSSSQAALLKTIVADDLLGEANAMMQTVGQGSRIITPLICAGLFTAFGAPPVILGDCASFLLAIGCLLAVRVTELRPAPSEGGWLAGVTAGARHIYQTIPLRQVAVSGCLMLTAFGLTETVAFSVVTDGLHRPATFLGVLLSGQGLGAIVAGFAAGRLIRAIGEGLVVSLGLAAAAASFLLQITPNAGCAFAGFVLLGACISWVIVGTTTMLQRQTPHRLVGRANAAMGFLTTTPQTIAIAVGAALVAVVDFRLILLAMAGSVALTAGYLASRPDQRRPKPDHPHPGSS